MVLALAAWIWTFAGDGTEPSYYASVGLHAHETLFGYTVAVMAGFFLVAVHKWTGHAAVNRAGLNALVSLWLAARILPWLDPYVSPALIAATDLLFLPLLAFTVAKPIVRHRLKQHYIYIVLLTLMAVANVLIHAQQLNMFVNTAQFGLDAMVYLIVLGIIIVSGQLIPFVTKRELSETTVANRHWIEVASIVSFLLLALFELADFPVIYVSVAAIVATVVHVIRMAGWFDVRISILPQVWVLHTAYAWIIIGFALKALGANLYASHALHAFTAGGIGIMSLGLMCSWGNAIKSRPHEIKPTIVFAFVLINIAVLVRVISPIFLVGVYVQLAVYAGLLFALSFLPFLWVYTPSLLPRRKPSS